MRELPVGAAFGHSVKSTLNNLPFAFYVSWPWMLLLLPINVAGNLYNLLHFTPSADPAKVWQNLPPDVAVVTIAMALVALVAFSSIAVSWHRYVLIDEVPHGLARLRLDGTVWRYVGNAILIGIISALASFAILLLPGFVAGGAIAMAGWGGLVVAVPVVAAGFIYAIGLSMRFSIKLPAIAMQNRDITLGRALETTRGNQWRCGLLFFMVVLCVVAVGFLISFLTTALANGGSSFALITIVVVQMAVNWISTIWNVTLLTSLYGYFVEKRDF